MIGKTQLERQGLEVDEVLRLWLVNPPQYTSGLCLIGLIYAVVDMSSLGYAIAVHASGKVSHYQMSVGGFNLLTLPAALIVAYVGWNVYWIMASVAFLRFLMGLIRIKYARHIVGLSGRYWLRKILMPILVVSVASLLAGSFVKSIVSPSFGRVCLTTVVVEFCFVPLAWKIMLSEEERLFVRIKIGSLIKRKVI